MYRKTREVANQPEKFKLPFEGKLASDNRWVVMANLIPWSEFEEEYAAFYSLKKRIFVSVFQNYSCFQLFDYSS
jgi:hypothetical protein